MAPAKLKAANPRILTALPLAVGAFTGRAHAIEFPPQLTASLNGTDETRMITETHTVAIAQHPVSMRAVLLLLGWTREAANILPTLGLVVVAIGATQTTTGGIRRAVLIIAPMQ